MKMRSEDSLVPQPDRAESAPASESAPSTPKVLVVEDDACTAFVYKGLLQREGYIVQHCADGEAALGVLTQERFDAVILDLMMPKTDGMQVLKSMRSSPEHSMTPVIVVTGARLKIVEETAARFGARLYLEKSQHQELIRGIRGIVAERASLQAVRLRMAAPSSAPESKSVARSAKLPAEAPPEAPRGLARLFRLKNPAD